jgi:hypothetical protein
MTERMFKYFCWCMNNTENELLFFTAATLLLVLVCLWIFLFVTLLASGYYIFGFIALLTPIFMVLIHGVKGYNEDNK